MEHYHQYLHISSSRHRGAPCNTIIRDFEASSPAELRPDRGQLCGVDKLPQQVHQEHLSEAVIRGPGPDRRVRKAALTAERSRKQFH